jgi:hypothetical protein
MGGLHAEQLSNATGHAVPLMTVPGNGDVFCYRPPGIPVWAACTEDYQRRYIMPGWNRTHSLWSSFSVGLVHVILLDSEARTWCSASQNHTEQREFMEADLSAVDRGTHPWVVAVVHRPLYTSCLNGEEEQMMRDGFADLFERYNVDVVLNGHVHSYERTLYVRGIILHPTPHPCCAFSRSGRPHVLWSMHGCFSDGGWARHCTGLRRVWPGRPTH